MTWRIFFRTLKDQNWKETKIRVCCRLKSKEDGFDSDDNSGFQVIFHKILNNGLAIFFHYSIESEHSRPLLHLRAFLECSSVTALHIYGLPRSPEEIDRPLLIQHNSMIREEN